MRISSVACLLLSAWFAGTSRAEMGIASLNPEKKYVPKLLSEIMHEPDLRAADILLLQEIVDGPESHVADEVAAALGTHADKDTDCSRRDCGDEARSGPDRQHPSR